MIGMEDADLALALSLQEEENRLAGIPSGSSGLSSNGLSFVGSQQGLTGGGPAPNGQKRSRQCRSPLRPLPPPATSLVDESLELIDPTPDIYQLFRDFDKHFFWGKLGSVELKWSPRMTRCAGVCSYQPASGLCSVRLSRPLLTLRPRSDLVETLLHEMIHALLFVTHHIDNHEEHGPEFHRHMHRINKIAGTNISVYHTFHDEVRHMLTHWWRCTGACRRRPPHFGFVKRSMNRAPGKHDFWWRDHQASCGGTFEKIREPEGYGKKKGKKQIAAGTGNKMQDIRNFAINGKAVPPAEKRPGWASGAIGPSSGQSGAGGGRTPTARPPPRKPPPAGPPAGRPAKRPSVESGGPSSQKRPSGNPTGVRRDIATVHNSGGRPVNNIASNVHGFQRPGGGGGGSTAMAGGSRTVTVPPRRGGDREQPPAAGDGITAPFTGQGHMLGGAPGVPWYKRDPPTVARAASPAAASPSATPASRPPTGIFCSPETDMESIATAASSGEDLDSVEAASDTVTCPVCGEKVSLQEINSHVDLCLVAGNVGGGTERFQSDSVWEEDGADELMMSQAADELEASLETAGWEDSTEEDQWLADAVQQLETSTRQHGAAPSPASDASTVYDELLDGGRAAAAAASVPDDASTVHNGSQHGPIVIDSSDDEEDCSSQRANLSDVIKEFIRIEESDDDLFDE